MQQHYYKHRARAVNEVERSYYASVAEHKALAFYKVKEHFVNTAHKPAEHINKDVFGKTYFRFLFIGNDRLRRFDFFYSFYLFHTVLNFTQTRALRQYIIRTNVEK